MDEETGLTGAFALKEGFMNGDILLNKDFEKRETDHMDNIRDTIECRANAVIRADFLRDRREAR